MSTTQATVTAKLFNLFDKLSNKNVASVSLNLARDAAKLEKFNTTSAEIAFYNWRMQRGFYAHNARPLVH
jgi:hypothetical protein